MKPRLRLRFGIWACVTFKPWFACGCAESPLEAFREWERIVAEAQEAPAA